VHHPTVGAARKGTRRGSRRSRLHRSGQCVQYAAHSVGLAASHITLPHIYVAIEGLHVRDALDGQRLRPVRVLRRHHVSAQHGGPETAPAVGMVWRGAHHVQLVVGGAMGHRASVRERDGGQVTLQRCGPRLQLRQRGALRGRHGRGFGVNSARGLEGGGRRGGATRGLPRRLCGGAR
jgi:hypothetical protein